MNQPSTAFPTHPNRYAYMYREQMIQYFLLSLTLFILYKIIYPYPDFITDSFYYIEMAQQHKLVMIWPGGYSLLLRAVRWFTTSSYFLVFFQFILLQAASGWLLFSVYAITQASKRAVQVSLLLLCLNPIYYYTANLVTSDAVFIALSFCWLALLIKIVTRPRLWHFIVQAPLLTYLIMVRHQGLYYPVLLAIALILSRYALVVRILSGIGAILLISLYVQTTKKENQRNFALNQFSALSGFQLSNNALYMYPYLEHTEVLFTQPPFSIINKHAKKYADSLQRTGKYWRPKDGPKFMLEPCGPLRNYQFAMPAYLPKKKGLWYYNKAGEEFNQYGKTLIMHYPFSFIRYFIIPNTQTYLMPALEQFEQYNEGRNWIPPAVVQWFEMENNGTLSMWPKGSYYLVYLFPWAFLLLNILLVVTGSWWLFRKKYQQQNNDLRKCTIVLAATFVCNAAFSIAAAPVMIRYQVFSLVTGLLLLTVLLHKKESKIV